MRKKRNCGFTYFNLIGSTLGFGFVWGFWVVVGVFFLVGMLFGGLFCWGFVWFFCFVFSSSAFSSTRNIGSEKIFFRT